MYSDCFGNECPQYSFVNEPLDSTARPKPEYLTPDRKLKQFCLLDYRSNYYDLHPSENRSATMQLRELPANLPSRECFDPNRPFNGCRWSAVEAVMNALNGDGPWYFVEMPDDFGLLRFCQSYVDRWNEHNA
jgi:hypothetical protein